VTTDHDLVDLWLDAMRAEVRCQTCALWKHGGCLAWAPLHCPAVREKLDANVQSDGDVPESA
jgi:hypothetical protein